MQEETRQHVVVVTAAAVFVPINLSQGRSKLAIFLWVFISFVFGWCRSLWDVYAFLGRG